MTKLFQSKTTVKILVFFFLAMLMLSLVMIFATDAFASGGPDLGKNIGTWLKDQAFWLAVGVVAAVAITFLVKRAWVQLVIFLVISAIVLAIISSPDRLQSLGEAFVGLFI